MNDLVAATDTASGRTLDLVLAESARRFPDKTALVVGSTRLSYAALDRAANGLAQGLRDLGVKAGDRVAVCLDNSVEGVVGYFAALKAGATVMMVNNSTKGDKLKSLLDDADASALVISATKAATMPVITTAASVRSLVLVGGGPEHVVDAHGVGSLAERAGHCHRRAIGAG